VENAVSELSRQDNSSDEDIISDYRSDTEEGQEDKLTDKIVGESKGMLEKDNLVQKKCTLGNLVKVLKEAFKVLDQNQIEKADIILAIGNTGCGKSTILNSLVFGPDSLQLKKIEEQYQVRTPDGRVVNKVVQR